MVFKAQGRVYESSWKRHNSRLVGWKAQTQLKPSFIFLGQIVSDCPPRRAQKDSSTLKVCIGSVADFVSLSGAPLKDCAWAKVSEVKIKRTDAPENWESTETTLKKYGT